MLGHDRRDVVAHGVDLLSPKARSDIGAHPLVVRKDQYLAVSIAATKP